jgi:glyoxylase-like metal-dependent hydrolase (beta-lactamase superfamily II)
MNQDTNQAKNKMSNIQIFTFNPTQENTYVISDDTKSCVIIDPGCYYPEEKKELFDYIKDQELTVIHLLNTHCHTDHVLGNAFINECYKVIPKIHSDEVIVLSHAKTMGASFGLYMDESPEPDVCLKEGEKIVFGNTTFEVIFTPGHSPGSVCFYNAEEKYIIGGDVLFKNSIGRTDLPGGDLDTLLNSISQKLFTLEDEIIVYPGHGPHTTIGYEKKHNPFLKNY